MASTLPFDMELEATVCRVAFSEDAVNWVFRSSVSREWSGVIIRISRLVHTTSHVTNTAANREAERDMQGTRARGGENSETREDQERQVVDAKGACATDRGLVKRQG